MEYEYLSDGYPLRVLLNSFGFRVVKESEKCIKIANGRKGLLVWRKTGGDNYRCCTLLEGNALGENLTVLGFICKYRWKW